MRQSLRLVSGLYLKLSLLTIAVGFLLRIVLLFNEQTTDLGFSCLLYTSPSPRDTR